MSAQITGESIKSAVANRLVETFGLDKPEPRVYKERILQNFKTPSFFIWPMNVSQEKEMVNTYTRSYQMNIRYHPPDKALDKFELLSEIGNRALESLRYILLDVSVLNADGERVSVTRPVRGDQMSFQIVEDVLQIYVTYSIRMFLPESDTPRMEELEINNETEEL